MVPSIWLWTYLCSFRWEKNLQAWNIEGNNFDKRNRSFVVDMRITLLLVLNKSLLHNTYYVHTRSINYYMLDYDEVKLDTKLVSLCKLRWPVSKFNTLWFLLQVLEIMCNDIDDRLRFWNANCSCGLRASVRISDKQNENWYRLFQCCLRHQCGFSE